MIALPRCRCKKAGPEGGERAEQPGPRAKGPVVQELRAREEGKGTPRARGSARRRSTSVCSSKALLGQSESFRPRDRGGSAQAKSPAPLHRKMDLSLSILRNRLSFRPRDRGGSAQAKSPAPQHRSDRPQSVDRKKTPPAGPKLGSGLARGLERNRVWINEGGAVRDKGDRNHSRPLGDGARSQANVRHGGDRPKCVSERGRSAVGHP